MIARLFWSLAQASCRRFRQSEVWLKEILAITAFSGAILCYQGLPVSAAEYLLSPGDTLELNVIGVVPELQHRAEIGVDGLVTFPLIGDVQAAGHTLKEVRAEVREALTRQPFRRETSSEIGSSTYSFAANEISLQIAEFRPVYVTGDVFHPGQVTYRPGLTVRQAIAIAGGYGRERSESGLIDVQNRYKRAALDFANYSLRVQSIEAALNQQKAQVESSGFAGVEATVVKAMTAENDERISAQDQAINSRRDFLKSALEQSNHRIDVLSLQIDNEQKGADLDAAEVSSVDDLFHKGLVAAPRLTEVRRSSLLSSSRALETRIAQETAKRDRAELESKLDSLDRDRKVELLTDLETSSSNLRTASLEMQGLKQQLASEGDLGAGVRILIFRKSSDTREGIMADEDTEIQPGDTVDVRINRQTNANAVRLTSDKE